MVLTVMTLSDMLLKVGQEANFNAAVIFSFKESRAVEFYSTIS